MRSLSVVQERDAGWDRFAVLSRRKAAPTEGGGVYLGWLEITMRANYFDQGVTLEIFLKYSVHVFQKDPTYR